MERPEHLRLVERALATGLVQPDATTCGSCVLVVARMVHDASYAVAVAGDSAGVRLRFRAEALATHRRTSALRGAGGWQVPWPPALGTAPWALAAAMRVSTGRDHRVRWVTDRASSFSRVAAWAGAGVPVPVYVGNRWAPRHVVLVLDRPAADRVRAYDPASGRLLDVTAGAFAGADLRVAGWSVPWCVVLPR